MAQIKPSKHEVTAAVNYIWATSTDEEAEVMLEYKKMMEGEENENTSD